MVKAGNYEFLMKAMALMINGELNFTGSVELGRFMTACKYVSCPLNQEDVWFLVKTSKTGSTETETDEKDQKIVWRNISY